jgi:hypothetical protein
MAKHHRVVGMPPVEHGSRRLIASGDQLALFDKRIDAGVGTLEHTLAETDEELVVEFEALLLRHERLVLGRLGHSVTGRAKVHGRAPSSQPTLNL